jgi:heat shock protein HslJ
VELAGRMWMLVSFETDMEVIPAATEAPATLAFSAKGEQAGRLSGSGGCNRYFASYTLTASVLVRWGPHA